MPEHWPLKGMNDLPSMTSTIWIRTVNKGKGMRTGQSQTCEAYEW